MNGTSGFSKFICKSIDVLCEEDTVCLSLGALEVVEDVAATAALSKVTTEVCGVFVVNLLTGDGEKLGGPASTKEEVLLKVVDLKIGSPVDGKIKPVGIGTEKFEVVAVAVE